MSSQIFLQMMLNVDWFTCLGAIVIVSDELNPSKVVKAVLLLVTSQPQEKYVVMLLMSQKISWSNCDLGCSRCLKKFPGQIVI